ncbi:MAG: Mu transposase domain-containing protein [Syntrophaceticus sp.]|jgi:transcriptional regulator with XRE-family HTH domain
MSDNLTIVRAVYSGLSQRQAAATYHVSRNTVSLLLRHARNQGWLTLEDLAQLDNAAFSKSLVKPTNPSRDVTFKMPDYEYVHAELAKPNVTLKLVNEAPLTGKSESRWSSYLAEEKDYMLPLPESPYELAQWGKAKVQPNCHIAFQRKFYSVPFEHLGEDVDIRATQSSVEIFYHHQRIASHKRLWGKANYATIMEHMPPDKLFFADWDRDRFLSWAEKTGSATRGVIEAILNRAIVEQQAYRSCFGVLNLQEKYGAERLERASILILSRTSSPTYQQLKNILEKDMDVTRQPKKKKTEQKPSPRGFQRGASYFGGDDHA